MKLRKKKISEDIINIIAKMLKKETISSNYGYIDNKFYF